MTAQAKAVSMNVIGVAEKTERTAQPYSNPYLAGLGLGLVLLAAFVVMGRGLGASGAFSSL
ncbi:MAG: putative transporter component, partial [Bacteroidetes bacterium]|nr:putative transporter component [Bacteroidota bacterium]